MTRSNNTSGFTLIELMISMVIAGLLLAAMVMAFTGQSRINNTQQEVSTLQEDMWAALQLISRDIRMAGYDPTGNAAQHTNPVANQFIQEATATTFHALQDINGDGALPPTAGNPEEDIFYSFSAPVAPAKTASLTRSTDGGTPQPVIDNITHLSFDYRTITTSGSLPWVWNPWITTPADLTTIRVVKVCMQGRTARQTSTTTDISSFHPPISGAPDWTPAAADVGKYQFRTMCIEIQCRNFID